MLSLVRHVAALSLDPEFYAACAFIRILSQIHAREFNHFMQERRVRTANIAQ